MWAPLVLGATAAIVPDGAHLDFQVVAQTISHFGVTVAHFVPSVLAMFLDFVSPGELPTLRQISCTGEALLLSHREKLTAKLGRALPLWNLYGPTEASIEVTFFEATADADGVTHGFPIGHPMVDGEGDDGVIM
jgi:non-ribosomal peptide synthetase component F